MAKNYKQVREYFIKQLEKKGFYVDNAKYENDGIVFSLTNLGLSCVYAEVTKQEIEHAVDNQDEDDFQ
jgi:predicted Zn-dependent protease